MTRSYVSEGSTCVCSKTVNNLSFWIVETIHLLCLLKLKLCTNGLKFCYWRMLLSILPKQWLTVNTFSYFSALFSELVYFITKRCIYIHIQRCSPSFLQWYLHTETVLIILLSCFFVGFLLFFYLWLTDYSLFLPNVLRLFFLKDQVAKDQQVLLHDCVVHLWMCQSIYSSVSHLVKSKNDGMQS